MKMLACLCLLLGMTGCAGPGAAETPTPTATATPTPHRVVPTSAPKPTVTVDRAYAGFAHTLCTDLRADNATGVINLLMYYQYNSGLRYGIMGDGEGQTADPSLMRTWLQGHHVGCTRYSAGKHGHGVLLTGGWNVSGMHWALVEVDLVNNHWKINDFTFGRHQWLIRAIEVAAPILPYRG